MGEIRRRGKQGQAMDVEIDAVGLDGVRIGSEYVDFVVGEDGEVRVVGKFGF